MAQQDGDLVLVTGASGYIAMHVVRDLLKANYRVRGSVRSLKNETKVAPLQELCPEAKYPLELVEAELLIGAGWEDAVKGCKYVMHIASPVPTKTEDENEDMVKGAVEGTLSVLRACETEPMIQRVVITGSLAAMGGLRTEGQVINENIWTDESKPDVFGYSKSKTVAEKAAWDFVKNMPDDKRFELVVLNPVFVFGPMLCNYIASSTSIVKILMNRETPVVVHLQMPWVDIRDVSAAHLAALHVPEAAGHRHLLVKESVWLGDIANILNEEFHKQGFHVPTWTIPSWLARFAAFFRSDIRRISPNLDREFVFDNSRMTEVLGIVPSISLKDSVVEMVYDMIEKELIPKPAAYTGRPV